MRKIILLLIVALLGACHTNQKKQNEQTAGHVKSISLENGNMVVTFEACPDSSIDMQAWQEHYNHQSSTAEYRPPVQRTGAPGKSR